MSEVDFSSVSRELFHKHLPPKVRSGELPYSMLLRLSLNARLRYGENPHQRAGMYYVSRLENHEPQVGLLAKLDQLWGKDWPENRQISRGLSGTNVGDIDAGVEAVRPFQKPAAVVIKHHNLCGGATAETIEEAAVKALAGDPSAAFGGIFVFNRTVTPEIAELVSKFRIDQGSNIDVMAAPAYQPDALKILRAVRDNMNVYRFGSIPRRRDTPFRILAHANGFVVQDWNDDFITPKSKWRVVTEAKPTPDQVQQMVVGEAFGTAIKSNAMALMSKLMLIGIGTGQTSRFRSTDIAISMAQEQAKGSVMISDGFIPFPDNMDRMIDAGVAALVQPGGSRFDKRAIRMADDAGMVMVFTGQRFFRH